ncbi:PD-(D/E)XK nuclease family protein [Gilvimarinus sp. DA14]|uniref:PD-(D/E)XK nuclease family protein n=1 Tax=Gilvimarinus sp. DA14 TaxID=2956798 RepID=UPI0020B696D2|nr:PD-(D/E)XK nuclease family protein [Gilvimarinus sp. DA14]UTF60728.1 PD-(D/E)XK nuclease family protein [Gilvimarinus sp. DA14]
MSAVLFAIEPLVDRLSGGQLLLTANNRQRNQILRAYHQYQHRQAKLNSWPEPRVYALNQWLERQWERFQFQHSDSPKALLNRWQTSLLWEQVITDSLGAEQLMQARQLASKAETARVALQAWRCPLTQLEQWPTAEPRFIEWYQAFHQQLDKHLLITREGVQERLLSALQSGELKPTANASVYGFDDIPPLTQALLELALPNAETVADPSSDNIQTLTSEADSESEIRRAALWADDILAKEPEAVIGIIVPELGRERELVERIFTEVFNPLTPQPSQPRQVAPFNFSAGTPLGQAPVIKAALELVALHCRPITTDAAARLLDSLFWGNYQEEKPIRAKAIASLRRLAKRELKSSEIRKVCRGLIERSESDVQLAKRLEMAMDIERQARFKLTISDWVEKITHLLEQLGWPGERRLDSVEYQQVALWHETLFEQTKLAQLQAPLSLSEALSLLQRQLEQTPFQPQTPDSPIQILGLLEASGLQFTHAWVMGMHQQAWPPAAKPNPLLPVGLQRDWQMPRASAERELLYAERLTKRLRQCAATVVFSYPKADGDRHLLSSALIQDIPAVSPQQLSHGSQSLTQDNYQRLCESTSLEWLDCEFGPPLDSSKLPGGSGMFSAQAKCPFSAFARYRLGAYAFDPPRFGFSAADRGNLLHLILAELWQGLNNQAELVALDANHLNQRVNQLAQECVSHAARKRPEISPALQALESERLSAQITQWLEFEKLRPDFAIAWLEQQVTAEFAGLQFDVRIDRMDTLDSGEHLLIDYKTGSASTNAWKELRFTDPQLPLYVCALTEHNITAIALVSINAKNTQLSGWGDQTALNITGIEPPEKQSWQHQLDAWQSALQQLAAEIRQGYASTLYRSVDAQRYDNWLAPLSRVDDEAQVQRWLNQPEAAK